MGDKESIVTGVGGGEGGTTVIGRGRVRKHSDTDREKAVEKTGQRQCHGGEQG